MCMNEDESSLFRAEAMVAARDRLWGELLLRSPHIAKFAIPLLVLGFALLGVLLAKASFVRSESVPGYVSTQGGWVRVYPQQEGRVLEVMVEEGDEVAKDQTLARLVNRRAIGDETHSEARLKAELLAQVSLLEEELLNEGARQQEESRWYRQERQYLENRHDVLSTLQQVATDQETLRVEALRRGVKLFDVGSIAKADLEVLRERYLVARAEGLNTRHSMLALESSIRKHEVEERNLPAKHFAQVSRLNRDLSKLKQQLAELQGYSDYLVTAPVAGRIRGVAYAKGDQIRRDRPLLSILDEDEGVRAVLLVPSRAIGFVREHQMVRLRYDAFPYERFGSHGGEITQVGRTSLSPNELSVPVPIEGPVYRVYVKPLESEVLANGETWPLLPGMALQGEIQLERRSLWQWLTAPLRSFARS